MDLVVLFTACALGSGTPRNGAHGHNAPSVTLAAADPIEQWEPLITEAAERFGIEAAWIRAVMRAESAGRTTLDGRPITSVAGAMGLMQLMPETYQKMRQALALGSDPYNPHDNIIAGTAFLRAMYDRFGYPGLFAAYNAGPERYDAWLWRGTPLPAETLGYLRAIGSDVTDSVLARGAATDSGASSNARMTSSRLQSEPQFQSRMSLFFVLGDRTLPASEHSNQVAETAGRAGDRASFFVPLGRESRSAAASNEGALFVPLSRRDE